MKTQFRATCPACFAQQAIRNGCMVAHGYRRPQHWHQNVGNCSGVGQPHFGTEAGRAYTAELADQLRTQANATEERAAAVDAGTAPVFGSKRVASGVNLMVEIENPKPHERVNYAGKLLWDAKMMRRQAAEFDAAVASWTLVEPVVVEVETKTTVHFHATWYNKSGHKACAASAMGAMRGYAALTSNPSEVTCERCKTRRVYAEALAKMTGS